MTRATTRRCARSTSAPAPRMSPRKSPPRRRAPRRCSASTRSTRSTARATSSMGCRSTSRENEIVALLGRNGAGKSTLLKTLIGIAPPENGSIKLAGEEIARLASAPIARRGIGYVPQGRGLFAGMTVARQPRARPPQAPDRRGRALGRRPHRLGVSRASRSAGTRRPTISPAASSRWSRSRARWPAMSGCCCSTSRSRGCRRRSPRSCSRRSTDCATRSRW